MNKALVSYSLELYTSMHHGYKGHIVGLVMDRGGKFLKELSHQSGIVRDMADIKKSFGGNLGMEAGIRGGHLCLQYN